MDRVFDKLIQLCGLDLVEFRNFLDFIMHLLNQNWKLLDLDLLILNFASLMLYESISNIELRLYLFMWVKTYHILADLDKFELQLFILDLIIVDIITLLLQLFLHLHYLLL